MKQVFLLTNSFPYFPGEQFIENEIVFWGLQEGADLTIIPLLADGVPRPVPSNVRVDISIAQGRTRLSVALAVSQAFFSAVFLNEVRALTLACICNPRCYLEALRSTAQTFLLKRKLGRVFKNSKHPVIAYSYWNDVQCYAAVLLKRDGIVAKVVSRAHGFDVYETRRYKNYMPLKRQFINEIDTLAISQQGKRYLEKTYRASAHRVSVSQLGVLIPQKNAAPSPGSHHLHLLSVASCIDVKQIDKLIKAIAMAAESLTGYEIQWTHIGEGPLLSNLKRIAEKLLLPQKVNWKFLGQLDNPEVRDYFENSYVDVFINTSKSEGVPVSIMEAMSYGVPVIAPNVGGISEIVVENNGILLSEVAPIEEISTAIVAMSRRCKSQEIRMFAKKKIEDLYDAGKNFPAAINCITR